MKKILMIIFINLILVFNAYSTDLVKKSTGEKIVLNSSNATTQSTTTSNNISLLSRNTLGYEVDALLSYGDGVNYNSKTIDAALTTIGSTTKATLILRPGIWSIDRDLVITNNITLRMPTGAITAVSLGKTLTISGPIEAGLYTIFSGLGNIKIGALNSHIKEVFPQWWGAKGDNISDDTKAIQAAIDSVADTRGPMVYLPGTDAKSGGYLFSNLLLHSGCHIKGSGSHRTNLYRKSGSKGKAITDRGNAMKIELEGFSVNGYGDADPGDGIVMIGDEANACFGSDAWMEDILVRGFVGDGVKYDGYGIKVHMNASFMNRVRSILNTTNFWIKGSAGLISNLVASQGKTNYKITGTGHNGKNLYSESAFNEHLQFGTPSGIDTARNIIDGFHATLKEKSTTKSVVRVHSNSNNIQNNAIKSGTLSFNVGSILSKLIEDTSSQAVHNSFAHIEDNNTFLGFWEYNPDSRTFKTKRLVDADFPSKIYAIGGFDIFDRFIIEKLNNNLAGLYLPVEKYSYGRKITVINNDVNGHYTSIRTHDGSNTLYRPYSTIATNSWHLYPGTSASFICSNEGYWYMIDSLGVQGRPSAGNVIKWNANGYAEWTAP